MQIPKKAIIYNLLIFCLSFLVISSVPYPDVSSNAYDRDPFNADLIYHLDEANGTANITDSSSNNLRGIIHNATIVDGQTNFSKAVCFDGSNLIGNISVPWLNRTGINVCSAWTISFWINSSYNSYDLPVGVFSITGGSSVFTGSLKSVTGITNFTFEYGTAGEDSESIRIRYGYNFEGGVWNHFALSKSQGCSAPIPGLIKLYINGTERLISEMNVEINNTLINHSFNGNLTLFKPGDGDRFRGCVDDLLFFNTNLTDGQIMQIYLGNYTSGTPSINATSPINNTLNNSFPTFEFNASDPTGDILDITLWLNGTVNATMLNVSTSPNGTKSSINISSGLIDGTYQYIIQACDNS